VEVSGPLAMMVELVGILVISCLMIRIFGCNDNASVILLENKFLSIARACPAGIVQEFATLINKEFSISNSLPSNPAGRSKSLDPKEFEQTTSPSSPVLCAPVDWIGRISYNVTEMPRWAACQAASQPDSPPPIIINQFMVNYYWFFCFFIQQKGDLETSKF